MDAAIGKSDQNPNLLVFANVFIGPFHMFNDNILIFEDFVEVIRCVIAAKKFESHSMEEADTFLHFILVLVSPNGK